MVTICHSCGLPVADGRLCLSVAHHIRGVCYKDRKWVWFFSLHLFWFLVGLSVSVQLLTRRRPAWLLWHLLLHLLALTSLTSLRLAPLLGWHRLDSGRGWGRRAGQCR